MCGSWYVVKQSSRRTTRRTRTSAGVSHRRPRLAWVRRENHRRKWSRCSSGRLRRRSIAGEALHHPAHERPAREPVDQCREPGRERAQAVDVLDEQVPERPQPVLVERCSNSALSLATSTLLGHSVLHALHDRQRSMTSAIQRPASGIKPCSWPPELACRPGSSPSQSERRALARARRRVLLVARRAVAGAHRPALRLAAGAVAVAHLHALEEARACFE